MGAVGPLRAFPGAEGVGTETPGGRGGRVIYVTKLEDSGPGSLREAIGTEGPRIVMFGVSGTIEVDEPLVVAHPFLTIAGQTAPGDGIALRSKTGEEKLMGIGTHDVVIRFVRFRLGPGGQKDNLTLYSGARRVVVDHCSLSWATDELMDFYRDVADVTVSWNIIGEALDSANHSKGPQFGKYETGSMSIHHNLFSSALDRCPKINPSYGTADFVNNVVHNCAGDTKINGLWIWEGETLRVNVVNNYYSLGPNSVPERQEIDADNDSEGGALALYLEGNIGWNRPTLQDPELAMLEDGVSLLVDTPNPAPAVTTTSAETARLEVLAAAGATLPKRDALDERLIREAREGGGQVPLHPDEVGGYPELRSVPAPVDSDGDGMPDEWEQRWGFDPTDGTDGSQDHDGDGYTNVEEYLAWIVSG